MKNLLLKLQKDYPELSFKSGEVFCWSPKTREVLYKEHSVDDDKPLWALMHEVAHALLRHENYTNDFELVQLESEAWQKARILGRHYKIPIPNEHIQDCLDTYRDWLHARSLCPNCHRNGLEDSSGHYQCLNCPAAWQVTKEKLKRVYRRKLVQDTV